MIHNTGNVPIAGMMRIGLIELFIIGRTKMEKATRKDLLHVVVPVVRLMNLQN